MAVCSDLPRQETPVTQSAKKEKDRNEFFARGVEAYRRITGSNDERYACPICATLFERKDLDEDRLTLEHVPPRSIGGKALCLTCADCNHTAGSSVDAAMAERKRANSLTDALGGKGKFEGSLKLTAGDIRINANVTIVEGKLQLRDEAKLNNPLVYAAQRTHFGKLREAGLPLSFQAAFRFRAGTRALLVSELRAGYLACFAAFGYTYVLDPNLSMVRQQLLNPKAEIVPVSAALKRPPASAPLPKSLFHAPSPVDALVVYFGHSMVHLPTIDAPDLGLYERIAREYATRFSREPNEHGVLDLHLEKLGWPTGMILSFDFG